MSSAFGALLASSRVSTGTRRALTARGRADEPGQQPMALSPDSLRTLRAVLDRLIPQPGPVVIDLAMRIDRRLAAGDGDGWRFAHLPPDAAAYTRALYTLNEGVVAAQGVGFAQLDAGRQDEWLRGVQEGRSPVLTASPVIADESQRREHLNARQMQAWFEDLLADAVHEFVGHPQTLEWMGYSGFANGGDGEPKSGFVRVGIADREAWEPAATPAVPK